MAFVYNSNRDIPMSYGYADSCKILSLVIRTISPSAMSNVAASSGCMARVQVRRPLFQYCKNTLNIQYSIENNRLVQVSENIPNNFFLSAFSANSAVNYYVSCSIRPAVFLAGGWAEH